MNANTQTIPAQSLGDFLRDRRARISPGAEAGRRRTPGLRREEVATRAGVSVTWYTWLEQGRGGAPSNEVLERLCRALELDESGRELLFILAQQRPPPLSAPKTSQTLPPTLQPIVDALCPCPAIVKTRLWDVVAWNDAAEAVLGRYGEATPDQRNGLRRLFSPDFPHAAVPEWEANARFAVSVFRVDVARAGAGSDAEALAAELHTASPDFRRFWAENETRSHGPVTKRMTHPIAGPLDMHTSAFAVDGAEGLTMIVFVPATPADAAAIAGLLKR